MKGKLAAQCISMPSTHSFMADRLPNDSSYIEEAPGHVQLHIPIQAHTSNLGL